MINQTIYKIKKNANLSRVKEEIAEFQVEKDKKHKKEMEEEFGDILFSLVNYARFVDINPEDALEKTNKKFIARYYGKTRFYSNYPSKKYAKNLLKLRAKYRKILRPPLFTLIYDLKIFLENFLIK